MKVVIAAVRALGLWQFPKGWSTAIVDETDLHRIAEDVGAVGGYWQPFPPHGLNMNASYERE